MQIQPCKAETPKQHIFSTSYTIHIVVPCISSHWALGEWKYNSSESERLRIPFISRGTICIFRPFIYGRKKLRTTFQFSWSYKSKIVYVISTDRAWFIVVPCKYNIPPININFEINMRKKRNRRLPAWVFNIWSTEIQSCFQSKAL